VRLYVELGELSSGERASEKNITAEMLLKKVKEILAPYTFDCLQIPWFSAYEVGQRLCGHFDNAKNNSLAGGFPNIFITGDACHTHSPKAGQGMNVSMADSFNLGWKLAAVLKGQSSKKILTTYTKERQPVAKELIDFDRDMAKLFSSKNLRHKEKNQFQTYFQKFGRYTAGVETCYGKSTLVRSGENQSMAVGLKIGMRFHSAPVVRLADAKRIQLGHICEADGRWRLFAFAEKNDFGQDKGVISNLVKFLYGDSKSPIQKYTAKGDDCDATVDFRVVFQQRHNELNISNLPSHLLPKKGRFGLVDYEKIFCSDHKIGPDIFDARGIDRQSGALIIVRPDQYIAAIMPLTDWLSVCKFFDSFMVEQD
jgi:phenol 2-monooxygenase